MIARVDALDADSGDFGHIQHELKGFGADDFGINSTTGDLYVAECGLKTCLDYEEQDTYTLTVTATDGGGLFLSVPVTVDMEDVNDNPPIFELNQYRRHIKNKAFDYDPPLVIKVNSIFFFTFKTNLRKLLFKKAIDKNWRKNPHQVCI